MTYCAAIHVNDGLVFIADSRTNAGVDQVSTYSKMHEFGVPGERQFVLLSAGNLGTTQAVLASIRKDLEDADAEVSLATVSDLPAAAEYIGQLSLAEQRKYVTSGGHTAGFDPQVSFILGGQVAGREPGIYLIYPQGNYITTSQTTRFLQIGESKYGKPILDRIIRADTSLADAARCALVSMDSTMRSNLTVGPPIEVQIYTADRMSLGPRIVLADDHPYLREIRQGWDENIREAFKNMPPLRPSLFKSDDNS
ncbi:peptidase [Acidihalobacter ferrooxydans]|uniref:Peptidase n=1 Tax=Acidihalobacter ferrooxydans TaxID=1765967 RepID=A0A1P8UK25_9GAMM|nr:peptidase [Acidihalobacter ferrooxydans]APZ44175.1 peptidase [Acidihalobacter ferrooxydans]